MGPGLGGLWRFADPLAKKLLIRQLVILVLLRIAPLRRLIPEHILDPPAALVPAVSVVALVGSAVFHRQGRPLLAKAVLHNLVAYGGIPVINESIGQMVEDVGDAGAYHRRVRGGRQERAQEPETEKGPAFLYADGDPLCVPLVVC